jgi:hypothetical protein
VPCACKLTRRSSIWSWDVWSRARFGSTYRGEGGCNTSRRRWTSPSPTGGVPPASEFLSQPGRVSTVSPPHCVVGLERTKQPRLQQHLHPAKMLDAADSQRGSCLRCRRVHGFVAFCCIASVSCCAFVWPRLFGRLMIFGRVCIA